MTARHPQGLRRIRDGHSAVLDPGMKQLNPTPLKLLAAYQGIDGDCSISIYYLYVLEGLASKYVVVIGYITECRCSTEGERCTPVFASVSRFDHS